MTVLSDKWIKNCPYQGYDQTLSKQVRKGKISMDYHLMVTMQEYLKNFKFLQTLIRDL